MLAVMIVSCENDVTRRTGMDELDIPFKNLFSILHNFNYRENRKIKHGSVTKLIHEHLAKIKFLSYVCYRSTRYDFMLLD